MTTTAYERIHDALVQAGRTVKDNGHGKCVAQCPAHDDGNPSLSVTGIEGSVLLYCHAGCQTDDVLAALNLAKSDLFDNRRDTTYPYSGGRRVHRGADKQFRQSGNKSDRSLFRADRVADADHVLVVEGEKDVLAAEAVGAAAVCSAMGAGKAHLADWSPLASKRVTVVADNDEPGRKHAAQVVAELGKVGAAEVRIARAAVGKDLADHIAAGHGIDDLIEEEDLPELHQEDLLHDGDDQRPVYPSPSAPLDVARTLFAAYRDPAGLRTLVSWRGTWMRWTGQHWAELDTAKLRAEIYEVLGGVDYMRPIREKGMVVDYERTAWEPNKRKVSDVLEAMSAVGHLGVDIDPPAWIEDAGIGVDAAQTVSCTNGILNLLTRTVSEHTPALFNVVSVPFAYDALSGPPTAWLEFLHSIWPDDPAQVDLLQEYVGYIISGRTDMQKLLLLVGPSRSGKGTIARTITSIVGSGHVAGPTLASLGTNFGLAPLLGKPLAIISDARLGSTPAHTIVERLLSITGEDMLTVDRKFREPWSGKLPTRFMVLSNELPRFKDSSGAIANRLLIAQMTTSFLGREDRELDRRLHSELPAILLWALDGLDRLTRNGRFTVPGSSEDAAALMMDLASPMSAFVRECCVRDPAGMVERDRLYGAWRTWCEDNGHLPGAKSSFGRDLRAVAPDLRDTQPRTGGVRVRYYERIRLRSTTDNEEHPVPPVPPDETAGHSVAGGTGHPVPVPVPDQIEFQPDRGGTGHPVPLAAPNPQVSGGGTGGTGGSPFKAQPGTDTGDVACSVCAKPIPESLKSARARGVCSRCKSHTAAKPGRTTEATVNPADDAANDAYRRGLCVDCRAQKPSPGRPRCTDCHRNHQAVMAGYDT